MSKPYIHFKIAGSEKIQRVEGQEARTLHALVAAGSAGITALEMSTWALRLAHYVMKLKKQGLAIDMEREAHNGPGGNGWHGRYYLRTAVEILSDQKVAA